jgi:hypothetical protein
VFTCTDSQGANCSTIPNPITTNIQTIGFGSMHPHIHTLPMYTRAKLVAVGRTESTYGIPVFQTQEAVTQKQDLSNPSRGPSQRLTM